MITIESLREFGADVDTGVKRCAGKENFYLMKLQYLELLDIFHQLIECFL